MQLSGEANAAPTTDEAVASAGHLSIAKNSSADPDPYVFGPLGHPNPLVRGTGPDPFVRGTDPRIRIHSKMSWIRNTGKKQKRTGPIPLC